MTVHEPTAPRSKKRPDPINVLQATKDDSQINGDPNHIKLHLETTGGEEDYEELPLFEDPLKTVRLGNKFGATKEDLMECLRRNHDVFAWSSTEILGIDHTIARHKLKIDPSINVAH